MTEHNLFQEVQEDLERQRLEALWKQYGNWLIILALTVICATAGMSAYRSWKAEHDQHLTALYLEAAKEDANASAAIDRLEKFAAANGGSNQADFALLRAGALAAEQDDSAKAIQFFDSVAHDDKADPAFRQLGDLLSVRTQMDFGDPAALIARLEPLTAEKGAWRSSALEDQGYLELRAGDKEKATKIFTDLSQDARVPQGISARATDILRSLN